MPTSLIPPWPNCLLLIAPLLAFNALLAPRLPAGLHPDRGVPAFIMATENALRVLVFVGPLWLTLDIDNNGQIALFVLGSALYLASWAPALGDTALAYQPVVYMLPFTTPLIWLLAVAWIGHSWPFAVASLVFVAFHATHGVFAFRTLRSHPRASR